MSLCTTMQDRVIVWGGNANTGGDTAAVFIDIQSDINKLYSNDHAFVAVKYDGSAFAWGDTAKGGSFGTDVEPHMTTLVRCPFFDGILHSRMPLVPTPAHLKRARVCQCVPNGAHLGSPLSYRLTV
jgi:hypothetical protein